MLMARGDRPGEVGRYARLGGSSSELKIDLSLSSTGSKRPSACD